jgi:hypothetical protein
MTPENIAGLTIPKAQLQELIDALAATQYEGNVIPLRAADEEREAA